MKENFEFDKIVIAISIALFSIVMSSNMGNIFYIPQKTPIKKGYEIEVTDASATTAEAPQGLPDVLDMALIMANTDVEAGKQIFNKCAVCHTIGKGEANKIGPNLWGIVSAKVARHDEFAYSPAMKKHAGEIVAWSYEELYRYLYSPKQHVPGTKMAFAGIKKDNERANLIAYIRTMADNPLPLPASK